MDAKEEFFLAACKQNFREKSVLAAKTIKSALCANMAQPKRAGQQKVPPVAFDYPTGSRLTGARNWLEGRLAARARD